MSRLHTIAAHAACALVAGAVSGCMAVLPNTISPEVEHMSHITQHRPFTDHPTDDGALILGATARWNLGRVYVEIAEGFDVCPHHMPDDAVGEIVGPREEFTARIGYTFTIH